MGRVYCNIDLLGRKILQYIVIVVQCSILRVFPTGMILAIYSLSFVSVSSEDMDIYCIEILVPLSVQHCNDNCIIAMLNMLD